MTSSSTELGGSSIDHMHGVAGAVTHNGAQWCPPTQIAAGTGRSSFQYTKMMHVVLVDSISNVAPTPLAGQLRQAEQFSSRLWVVTDPSSIALQQRPTTLPVLLLVPPPHLGPPGQNLSLQCHPTLHLRLKMQYLDQNATVARCLSRPRLRQQEMYLPPASQQPH